MVVVLLAACQPASAPPPSTPPLHRTSEARSAPTTASCKPEAPIAIDLAARPLASDVLEVIARARPTSAVASVDLQLALPPHAVALGATRTRVGASASGDVVTLTTRVRIDGRTSSITAIARVPVEDIPMARTATVAIGAHEPAPRTRAYALPDGELAREVRP